MGKVGVEYEIQQQEAGLFLHNVFEVYEFDTSMIWYFGGPTPSDALGYLQSSQINNAWFTNSPGFSNAEFDELFVAQRAEVDFEKRREHLYKMQALVMDDPPELFVCGLSNVYAWKKGWQGLPPPVGNPTEWYGDIWYQGE